jgi:hypothetical protein
MVDRRIIAILPHRESIIDALLMCLCESAAVVHVILIPSAFFDSHGRAVWHVRESDTWRSMVQRGCACRDTTACVQDAESTPH